MGRWVPLDLAINHVRKIYQRSLKRFQHTISRTGGNTPMLTLTYKETPRPTTLYLSNRDAELSFLMIHIQVHNIRPPLIAIVTCIWIAMLTSLKFPSIGSNIMLYRYSFVQNAMAYTHHEEQPTAESPQWPTILRYWRCRDVGIAIKMQAVIVTTIVIYCNLGHVLQEFCISVTTAQCCGSSKISVNMAVFAQMGGIVCWNHLRDVW